MAISIWIIIIGTGAILRYAVKDTWSAVDLPTVGLILMAMGFVGLVIAVAMAALDTGSSRGAGPTRRF